ncbi:GNAT family N-acetyltransferase [Aidingimonas halophila]|uniref:Ribosomal-protein-alanine N-acetyltransferase n=1 Tax=Aidingimonas halophila TaxID=574349 RepID=A0A1H2VQM1_9GAMM|nr:GNAT family N-acetyltransferase [Aidingimonas halophila]GHC24683.1 ribosomal-protein-alanine acetyltransferase [Aidingimonas halophila]SDW70580.1 ribosomal-protein-alanine N-acetyltransferase [Aidingimonas halophila]
MADIDFYRLDASWQAALLDADRRTSDSPWSIGQWAAVMADPQTVIWGAADDQGNSLVAFAVLARLPFEAELQRIGVIPQCRRQGIAYRLLDVLMREAKGWQSERVLLEVRAGNRPARRLYQQFGFVEEGCRPGYYPPERRETGGRGQREDAILMSRRP